MNLQLIRVVLLFVAAGTFLGVGLRAEPRNSTYLVIGVVFLVLALLRFRRYKASGTPTTDLPR